MRERESMYLCAYTSVNVEEIFLVDRWPYKTQKYL